MTIMVLKSKSIMEQRSPNLMLALMSAHPPTLPPNTAVFVFLMTVVCQLILMSLAVVIILHYSI